MHLGQARLLLTLYAARTTHAGSASQRVSRAGFDVTPLTAAERAAEAAKLSDFQRHVTLEAGTERAFTGVTADGLPW
jgi:non-canonical (house-cleaning) NTP pyrophosphatase